MKKLLFILVLVCLCLTPQLAKADTHGALTSISISPVNGQVKAGQELSYTLTAKDSQGKTWDITQQAIFEVNDPRGIMVENDYLAGKVGTWQVKAYYGNFSAKTKVKVLPGDVASLQVNPNSQPEVVILGLKKTFTAQAFDKMANLLKGVKFAWSPPGDLGTIDKNGVFTAADTGEGKIVASIGDIKGSSAIKVREKTLLPATPIANTNTAPQTQPKKETNTNQSNINQTNTNQGEVKGAETAKAAEVTTEKNECKTMAWYWWIIMMVGFFAVLIIYYFLVRQSRGGWWWIFPLILTAAAVWSYYQYACNKYAWWPWVTMVMAILITLFRPKKYFEEPKSPTF